MSWDHLVAPAVSLLSGVCISTAQGVTNCFAKEWVGRGWEGIDSIAT